MTLAPILVSLFPIPVGPAFADLQAGSPAPSFAPSMTAETSGQPDSADQLNRTLVNEAYGKLPLRFEANAGQADKEIKFLSRGKRTFPFRARPGFGSRVFIQEAN